MYYILVLTSSSLLQVLTIIKIDISFPGKQFPPHFGGLCIVRKKMDRGMKNSKETFFFICPKLILHLNRCIFMRSDKNKFTLQH